MADPLVLCVACTAMRSSRVKECFCGETRTKPAPPPKPSALDATRPIPNIDFFKRPSCRFADCDEKAVPGLRVCADHWKQTLREVKHGSGNR